MDTPLACRSSPGTSRTTRSAAQSEGATCLMPLKDVAGSVTQLVELARDRSRLSQLTEAALRAAHYHAADSWYRRRAEWTIEAIDRDTREGRPT